MTINDQADAVITALMDATTAPEGAGVVYLRQRDLMAAAGVQHPHTFGEIIKRASLRVRERYAGYAIFTNTVDGYRILDAAEARDKRVERGRLRKARTALKRLGVTLGAARNSQVLRMVGRQVEAIVDTVIEPALAMLDEEIGA